MGCSRDFVFCKILKRTNQSIVLDRDGMTGFEEAEKTRRYSSCDDRFLNDLIFKLEPGHAISEYSTFLEYRI